MNNIERALNQLSNPPLRKTDFVSVAEAAVILNKSVRTVRYWEKAGLMPARKRFGKQLMYKRQDVLELAPGCEQTDA
ncbi:helix-turn-helix domain-containing protein [Aestuariivita sp.]|jgi:hypothetical protein|uniref:helix-turn-helix domain-containing protein n=1 Tax=Aestuariivita sp. TaxID=1872407 RepID=UPI00217123A0|nr:helix-turn-helix domain-containing protein [Aestuariivita sp.]MCE8006165.1 helix-turn-helix domain-containing protein [Aestuariivita sp.]